MMSDLELARARAKAKLKLRKRKKEASKTGEKGTSKLDTLKYAVEEGTTFGGDDLLAGASAAIGEYLGTSPEDAEKLRQLEAQGFSGVDAPKKNPLEQMRDTYYEAKGEREKLKEKAAKDNPEIYYPAMIASGMLTGNVGSIAAKGSGKVAQLASKILPKTSGSLTKEALKGSALAGFTEGESKLLEGDVLGTVGDVASNMIVGSTLANVPGLAVKGVKTGAKTGKKVLEALGEASGISEGLRIGSEFSKKTGKFLNKKNTKNEIQSYSKDLYDELNKTLEGLKIKKNEIKEIADEVGARVNAGEEFEKALDKAVGRKAVLSGEEARQEWVKVLKNMKGSPEEVERVKNDLIKKAMQRQVKSSGDVITSFQNAKKKVVENIDDMSVEEANALLDEINKYSTGLYDSPPKIQDKEVIKEATELAKILRAKIDKTMNKFGDYSGVVEKLSNVLSAKELIKIKPEQLVSGTAGVKAKEAISKIEKMIFNQGEPSVIDKELIFDILKGVDPSKYGELEKSGILMGKARELVESTLKSSDIGNTLKGVIGQKAGAIQSAATLGKQAVNKRVAKAVRGLNKKTPDQLKNIASSIAQKGRAGASYARVLSKASEAPRRARNAILFNLQTDPAFKELVKDINILGENDQDE